MSAHKHTPGPWQMMNGTDVFTPLASPAADGRVTDDTDGWHIADCDGAPSSVDGGWQPMTYQEKIANARLIASAPELLDGAVESVKEIIRLRDAMFRVYATASNGGNVAGAIEKMRDAMDAPWSVDRTRAAIAKATGGDA